MKDDVSLNMSEGKSSRRGVSGHSAHEVCVVFAKSTVTSCSGLLHFTLS